MSILGEWQIGSASVVEFQVVEQGGDVIRIEERSPAVVPRRARYTCIRGGMVEFSGDLDLNAAGDKVSGTFTDGKRYSVEAGLQTVGGEVVLAGVTTRKGSSDVSTGQWDGKRKGP